MRTGSAVCSVSHHRDYITCLAVSEAVQQSSAQNTIFSQIIKLICTLVPIELEECINYLHT